MILWGLLNKQQNIILSTFVWLFYQFRLKSQYSRHVLEVTLKFWTFVTAMILA